VCVQEIKFFGDFDGNNQSLDEEGLFFIPFQEGLLAMESVTDNSRPP
jgi:hypothetical protein